ncbi:hypothetical protein SGPA1_40867 [Streptomyces misionensis JCM 4497]
MTGLLSHHRSRVMGQLSHHCNGVTGHLSHHSVTVMAWLDGNRGHKIDWPWRLWTFSPSRGTAPRRWRRSPRAPGSAVAAGLERASSEVGPMNRDLGPRLKAAVAAGAELQERNALKSVGLANAMTGALVARGVPEPTAHLAAELGVLAFKRGCAQWSEADREPPSPRSSTPVRVRPSAGRHPPKL